MRPKQLLDCYGAGARLVMLVGLIAFPFAAFGQPSDALTDCKQTNLYLRMACLEGKIKNLNGRVEELERFLQHSGEVKTMLKN